MLRGWWHVGPGVVVTVGDPAAGRGGPEPWVLVLGVRQDQVCQHADAAVPSGADELLDVAEVSQALVDVVVVGHVVAVVAPRCLPCRGFAGSCPQVAENVEISFLLLFVHGHDRSPVMADGEPFWLGDLSRQIP